jgi:hypothetical protein
VVGVAAACRSAGGAQIRAITIDLDAVPPKVRYGDGRRPAAFTVAKDETETFDIRASTQRAHYRWLLELDVVAEGRRQTITVSGRGGRPFETTPDVNESWEWNYQTSWQRMSLTDQSGTSPPVRAGAPLPAEDTVYGSGNASGPSTAGPVKCGDGLSVSSRTSCAFGKNVRRAYQRSAGGEVKVTAFSAATGNSFTMSCSGDAPHVCVGGSGASVYFPR